MSKVLAIARYTLLEAVRNRLLWLVLALLVVLLIGSLFVQQVAITETARMRAGFLAGSVRLAAVFVVCLHVASSMVRDFNDKAVDLLLSLDLPRAGYYLGKLLGFTGVAVAIACLAGLLVATAGVSAGLPVWIASLALELTLIATLTLFCVITFAQIMPAVSMVAAFYLLARSIEAIRLISRSQLVDPTAWTTTISQRLVDGLALLLPDLSRFTATAWLLDEPAGMGVLAFVALQSVVYGMLLTLAGLFDLYRKSL
jgi:ABC-type transport system involved in multi-copper enzyme maturation permease subunit